MPDAQEKKSVKPLEEESSARRKFRLVLAALFVPGVPLMLAPELTTALHLTVWPWVPEALSKFGDALVIAGFLAVGVDNYVKRTLVSEVAKDAIDFAVGYELPGEIKRHLVDDILRLPCVRRGLVFHYEFHQMAAAPPEHPDPYFKVICFTCYEIVNLTDRPIPFDVRTSIPKTHLPGLPPSQLWRLCVPTKGIDMCAKELKVLAAEQAKERPDVKFSPYITATREVNIRAGKANVLPVETERISYYRLEDSIFLDILQPPSLGLDLKVTAPEGYTFEASFGAAGDPLPDHKGGSWSWQVPGVHLPGSHLYLSWYRVSSNTATPTAEPVQAESVG